MNYNSNDLDNMIDDYYCGTCVEPLRILASNLQGVALEMVIKLAIVYGIKRAEEKFAKNQDSTELIKNIIRRDW